jgi:hypothetical protein
MSQQLEQIAVEVVRAFAAVLALPAGSAERARALRRCVEPYRQLMAANPVEDAASIAYRFSQLGVPMGAALVDVSGLLEELATLATDAPS